MLRQANLPVGKSFSSSGGVNGPIAGKYEFPNARELFNHPAGGIRELTWFLKKKEMENYRTIKVPDEYALWRHARRSDCHSGAWLRDEGGLQRSCEYDPRRARSLRPGTAERGRLLAAEGVHGKGRLRSRCCRNAAGRRHALAAARHLACHTRSGGRERQAAGSARRLRQPAGIPPCGRDLRDRQETRSRAGLRHARQEAPGRGPSQHSRDIRPLAGSR